MTLTKVIRKIAAEWITVESFQQFGQVIRAISDSKPYDSSDAQLVLQNGTPRFYIMRLYNKGLKFSVITRHHQCTQSLGSLGGKDWFIAVASPHAESHQLNIDEIKAFRIPGDCFIHMNPGTWHAGPYFEHEFVDFYNLELSDTNIVDHDTYHFGKTASLELEFVYVNPA